MSESVSFEIGQGFTATVGGWEELRDWVDQERSEWSWLRPGEPQTDRLGFANHIQGAWSNIYHQINDFQSRGESLTAAAQLLSRELNGAMLVSRTPNGMAVLDVREALGDQAASFAGSIVTRQTSPAAASTREEFMGMMQVIYPDLSNAGLLHNKLKQERARFRQATYDLSRRVERESEDRRLADIERGQRLLRTARRIFQDRRARWDQAQRRFEDSGSSALESIFNNSDEAVRRIESTRQSYTEGMRLKAPVEYWETKKSAHETREKTALHWLRVYFPVAIFLLAGVFGCAGYLLLNHPDTESRHAPVALYVVVSGGLLLASTMVFWIGRLLTKLYLSEHHLRNDAEERAVMTTTYLALYNDSSAAEADRKLILSALFRPTPDGIVKDDGPSDLSLQGIAARMLAK